MPAFVGTATSAVRTSGANLAANLKPDIDSIMRKLMPYQTPITDFLLFGNKKVRTVKDKRGAHSWFEKSLFPHYTTVAGTITGGSTITLTTTTNVADAGIFKLYDMIIIDDSLEMGYISTVTSATEVIATPLGTSTFATVSTTGGYVRIIGSVNPEVNSTPTNMWVKEVQKTSYVQIFAESVKTTGRDQAGETYTDDTTHAEEIATKLMELKFQIERACIYNGTASTSGTGASYKSYTQGLRGTLYGGTNSTSYTGALTEDAWDAYLGNVFAQGSGNKVHYCGTAQAIELSKIVKTRLGVMPTATGTKYGWHLTDYNHTLGNVKIVTNYVMDGKFTDWGFTLDVDQTEGLAMANDKKGSRKLRVEANVETPGYDQTDTKILADVGFKVMNESKGGVLYKA